MDIIATVTSSVEGIASKARARAESCRRRRCLDKRTKTPHGRQKWVKCGHSELSKTLPGRERGTLFEISSGPGLLRRTAKPSWLQRAYMHSTWLYLYQPHGRNISHAPPRKEAVVYSPDFGSRESRVFSYTKEVQRSSFHQTLNAKESDLSHSTYLSRQNTLPLYTRTPSHTASPPCTDESKTDT